jgi:hypothetical protein
MTFGQEETYETLQHALQVLVGEKLSAVTFVLDYWQLDFDGSGFTVTSKITVSAPPWMSSSGEPGFRDRLCEQIAKNVASAEFRDDEGVCIIFEDGSVVHLSTRPQDYQAPEAIEFRRVGSGRDLDRVRPSGRSDRPMTRRAPMLAAVVREARPRGTGESMRRGAGKRESGGLLNRKSAAKWGTAAGL